MIVIFFGPPGAGKGTQASLISKKYNIPHLSTGEIFRNKLLEKDTLSIELKKILDSGELVSNEITNEVVSQRIDKNDCSKGFILDGYPRTNQQALFLKSKLDNKKLIINKIIDIQIDEKKIFQRIKSRSSIEKREDDNQEIIKTRILKYIEETRPLSEYYKTNYFSDYHIVNGNREIEEINADILFFLENTNL
tara:strand:- start:530 stop:1108 length:579 start_codon:yes stop_codon:yes gene_type:complete